MKKEKRRLLGKRRLLLKWRRILGGKEETGLETLRMLGIRGECRKKGENTGQKEKILGLGK
jgi:hypothetical protein